LTLISSFSYVLLRIFHKTLLFAIELFWRRENVNNLKKEFTIAIAARICNIAIIEEIASFFQLSNSFIGI